MQSAEQVRWVHVLQRDPVNQDTGKRRFRTASPRKMDAQGPAHRSASAFRARARFSADGNPVKIAAIIASQVADISRSVSTPSTTATTS